MDIGVGEGDGGMEKASLVATQLFRQLSQQLKLLEEEKGKREGEYIIFLKKHPNFVCHTGHPKICQLPRCFMKSGTNRNVSCNGAHF